MVEQTSTVGRAHIFPPWLDRFVRLCGAGTLIGVVYIVLVIYFGFSPKATDAGYMPAQPVPYDHSLHAGELGLDCRYCHTGVERSPHASIPPTATCMNCHAAVGKTSTLLEPVRESYRSGLPIPWVRVHDLPDYVYFDHSAHVRRGVGCAECHGRVDRMSEVYQVAPLSMGWCLGCHRDPAPRLRPPEAITDMSWGEDLSSEERREIGERILDARGESGLRDGRGAMSTRFQGLTSCSTCHR